MLRTIALLLLMGSATRSFEHATPLETVAETTANVSLGDLNGDGNLDIVLAKGRHWPLPDVVLFGDGHGHFTPGPPLPNAPDRSYSAPLADLNGDGTLDMVISNDSPDPKVVLLNDGKGRFRDVTVDNAPELSHIGFVTRALWFDLDKNGEKDLILSLEWGGIIAFMNHGGVFTKKILTDKKGWWNFILPVDLNHDGNIDLIAGNLGLNSRLKASEDYPVRLYYNDFDGNGKKAQILTCYIDGRELPFANKDELEKRMPGLKKKFQNAEDFAKTSLTDLFPEDKLRAADTLTANYFSNAILINHGNLNFTVQPMPWQAQLSPYRDAAIIDANGDSLPDILLVGNYYGNNIQMGRYDADYGTILLNQGANRFTAVPLNGLSVEGETRRVQEIVIAGQKAYVLARNNDSLKVIRFGPAN